MFLNELIIKGGPVLYLLFFLTLIIFTVLINKYYFVFFDKNSKKWRVHADRAGPELSNNSTNIVL